MVLWLHRPLSKCSDQGHSRACGGGVTGGLSFLSGHLTKKETIISFLSPVFSAVFTRTVVQGVSWVVLIEIKPQVACP